MQVGSLNEMIVMTSEESSPMVWLVNYRTAKEESVEFRGLVNDLDTIQE